MRMREARQREAYRSRLAGDDDYIVPNMAWLVLK
jgi:hypothetical protein